MPLARFTLEGGEASSLLRLAQNLHGLVSLRRPTHIPLRARSSAFSASSAAIRWRNPSTACATSAVV